MSSHPPLRSFIKCSSKHHQQQFSGPKAAWLDDSHRVLIVVTISFRRMKTAVALTKEEADEEKRRQRKTQNERKTRNTYDPNLLFSPRRLPRHQHHHHSEYLPSRTRRNQPSWISSSSFSSQTLRRTWFFLYDALIFCRQCTRREEDEKKRSRLSEKRRTRRGKSEISSVNVLSIIP